MKIFNIPTGKIAIMQGEKGKLEFLSIGDYGRDSNVKADFLGLTDEIEGVPNGQIMPLSEKWVITLSTQYGCSMNCGFCDVPKVGPGINATYHDLLDQIKGGINLYPDVEGTKRLNIHFARMGEPTFNGNVLDVAACLRRNLGSMWSGSTTVHPVISTMMPKNNRKLFDFLRIWIEDIKNKLYDGEAGLQLSINTTDERIRSEVMPCAMNLDDISVMMFDLLSCLEGGLRGRKIALNFALTDAEIDADRLRMLFSPKYFMCKITPMHLTDSCVDNGLITKDGYKSYHPYKKVEEDLKRVGFDVLVFIPSTDEDLSRITCGNAILSGTNPEVPYTIEYK